MEYRLIGTGRTSDVFEYNEYVLKLYKENMDIGLVEREYYFSKFVYDNGISTPKPKAIVSEQNKNGIIFQKINGQLLLKIVIDNPLRFKHMIIKLVELQLNIHNIELENNEYTFKKYLIKAVENNSQLENSDKTFIQEYIKKLPEGSNLCHGDFHPENILFDNKDYYIIDWMTAMQGNIADDVARTEMIIKNAEISGNIPSIIKKLMTLFQKKIITNIYKRIL